MKAIEKNMKLLKHILEDHNIYDIGSFRKLVLSESRKPQDSGLELLRSKDIGVDTENRLYKNKIEFSKKIIDVPEIRIQNSSEVNLTDCIFCGNLYISQKENKSTRLFIDYCIVLGSVVIVGIDNKDDSIEITRLNCEIFCLNNITINNVSISHCHFFELRIYDSRISSFSTFKNRFDFIDIINNTIAETSFGFEQVVEQNLRSFKNERLIKKRKKQLNLFDFDYIEKSTTNHKNKSNRDTLQFLIQKSNLKSYREKLCQVLYLENLSTQNLASKIFLALFGCFIKPLRIVLLGLLVYLLFVLIYTFPCMTFVKNTVQFHGLDFLESLYFSGITFTTIGYGDIAPIGVTTFIAVIEGFLGVLLISSFLVSLVRRFADS